MVVLRDNTGKANLVHASSVRGKHRARSVLGAEMFAFLNGFDAGYIVRYLLSKMLGRNVELHLLTDSRSAYHIATTLVTTRERRLMLDVHFLREAYELREITKITWISGQSNIADCLTKVCHNGTLYEFVKTNHLEINCEGWVDRDVEPVHALGTEHEPTLAKETTYSTPQSTATGVNDTEYINTISQGIKGKLS